MHILVVAHGFEETAKAEWINYTTTQKQDEPSGESKKKLRYIK